MSAASTRTISPLIARRLAVASQGLAAPRAPVDSRAVLDTVRRLGCLQLDPISAVARSHQLVLFSRLGPFDLDHLDQLLWRDRSLFEYWAHAASIVLTEDYPIHHARMRNYLNGASSWARRVKAWVQENDELCRHILDSLKADGPLPSRAFTDKSHAGWYSSGWTSERNVSQMLQLLWTTGKIMVAARRGGQKYWDLSERVLPEWTPRDLLPDDERVALAAQKSLKALGVAKLKHIEQHFTRGRYPGLRESLKALEREGRVHRLEIQGDGRQWAGPWYIHADALPLLERFERGEWEGQVRLLSPFDNLICDRARTEQLFDFRFRIEIYVPRARREYGYYVLPVLHGDRLIGRIDPVMDRKAKRLTVNAVYAEPDAPATPAVGRDVAAAIEELAAFVGARSIAYTDRVPEGWRGGLRA